jgi:8-oxo-dGTP pyrophosphatase MutT (NUDIX family)
MPQISSETLLEHNHQRPQLSATTLLILERSEEECQIFVLKRQNRGGFLGDALVFPGGVVEEIDYASGDEPLVTAAVREIREETGLLVDPNTLTPFSWWLTPKTEKRRFDTHFFVAPYPQDQAAAVNLAESQWGALLAPSEILAQHARGEAHLVPPTLLTLEHIRGARTLAEVRARAHDLEAPICPELQIDAAGERILALPESSGFARRGFKITGDGRFS